MGKERKSVKLVTKCTFELVFGYKDRTRKEETRGANEKGGYNKYFIRGNFTRYD